MSTTYKQGDRVQITIPAGNTDTYGGDYFVTGGGTVLEVDVDGGRTLLQVKADTKHPLRNAGQNWWADTKFVTPLAVELPFEVGARVRSKDGYYGGDSEGIVTDLVPHIGGDITIAWDKGYALAGATCGATRSKLTVIASPVVERPKAIPATDTKPQIGDTIVAFWEVGGVETRKKGVIASFDWDGTAVTEEGGYITYDDSASAESDSVFIVERAPKPEPVKENPNQKWIDAPIGSIATLSAFNFQWKKTAENEWTFFNTKTGRTFVDRTDETINFGGDTLLLSI